MEKALSLSLLGLLALSSACTHQAGAELPALPPLADYRPPPQPYKVAILPLRDARPTEEAPDAKGRFIYRGQAYVGTTLEQLGSAPVSNQLTTYLARFLAYRRIFAQVILVDSLSQAQGADLVLSGEVVRMRGYIETTSPDKKSGRPEDERQTLSEVYLRNLRLVPLAGGLPLWESDLGWASQETISTQAKAPLPSPWQVLAPSLTKSLEQLAQLLEKADLSGQLKIPAQTALSSAEDSPGSLDTLAQVLPASWKIGATSSAAAPRGWNGPTSCQRTKLVQRQTQRFHRVLGPYQPSFRIYRCPTQAAYSYQSQEEFPARYMGKDSSQNNYFFGSTGQNNWPSALQQLQNYLRLSKPNSRYIFKVGG